MEKNIFDILNEGYEHISYIKNVEKNKKQVYQPSIGNMETITDNMIIGILNQLNKTEIAELSKNHYLNERIYEVAPNIKWNWLDISENPNLSVDFIQRNYNKLCLNTLMKHNVQFNNFIRLGKY
jgi:hypothetical protein